MRTRTRVQIAVLLVCLATPVAAQLPFGEESGHGKKAQGAIVIRDGAPAFKDKSSTDVVRTFKRGECVAGLHRELVVLSYEFVEENGRVRVIYPKRDSAKPEDGWMDPMDLAMFTYDCGCEPNCMPWAASLGHSRWNLCYQEARDNKLDRLKLMWAEERSRGESPHD